MNAIERLEELAAKASGRTWRIVRIDGEPSWVYVDARPADTHAVLQTFGGNSARRHANSEFMVALVNAWPDLLKIARVARAVDETLLRWNDEIGEGRRLRLVALHDTLEPLFREDPSDG